jgi:eukaryotic-like serine/threonine-protein kinase
VALEDHGSLVGRQLSDTYRIVRQLAHGGMGAIYEAVHLRLGGKRYAIKVLASRYASNPDAVARFRREALVTSGLHNEHIVEVHDFNIDGGLAYLVMELLVGEDLAARLKRARALSIDATAHILAQVVAALDAAHRARIVHRDLKPQNIFLCTRDGRDDYVKVLDFGISKLLDSSTMLTGEHALLGTPYYMAPEQALGKSEELDGRADVFALGAILWELLTGWLAFAAPTLSAALYKVCQVDPPDVHAVRPDLPPAVSMVLRRALAKDPAGRTPDVVTLGREFAAALQGVAPDCVPPPAPGGTRTLAEVLGTSPDTVASFPAVPVGRIVPPTALEAGGRLRAASGSPNHGAALSPAAAAPAATAAANPVPPVQVASAALPAWMPSWPTGDRPAPPDAGLAPAMAIGSVFVPTRRSRGRTTLALAVAGIAATLMGAGIVLAFHARSSSGAGEATVAASPSPPPAPAPPPAPPPADEVTIVFAVEPEGAEVVLRIDGVVITDRRVRHARSGTPLVVTAEAAGYLAFRADPVPDRDQIVPVTLRPSPAVTAKGAPPRHAPAPVGRAHTEPHPRPSRATAAGAGSSAPKSDAAPQSREPPPPTVPPDSRPRYVPSSVTGHAPPGPGASSSPERAASAPADGGASKGSAAGSAAPPQPGAQPSPQVPAPAAPPPANAPPQPPPKTGTIFDNP